jgi:hypothetical protein
VSLRGRLRAQNTPQDASAAHPAADRAALELARGHARRDSRGTIDDEGETLADALAYVQGTFAGEQSGRMLEPCSFVIEEQGKPLGAILISEWEGRRWSPP